MTDLFTEAGLAHYLSQRAVHEGDRMLVEFVEHDESKKSERLFGARDWLPANPPHVDSAKWGSVKRELEGIFSVLEEAEPHLNPDAVMNLLTEAAVGARKLGVELEAATASVRRSQRRATA